MSDVENAQPSDLLVVTHDGDAVGSSGHDFREGEVIRVKLVNRRDEDETVASFMAEHLDGSDYWWIRPREVRVATPGDIMALGVA